LLRHLSETLQQKIRRGMDAKNHKESHSRDNWDCDSRMQSLLPSLRVTSRCLKTPSRRNWRLEVFRFFVVQSFPKKLNSDSPDQGGREVMNPERALESRCKRVRPSPTRARFSNLTFTKLLDGIMKADAGYGQVSKGIERLRLRLCFYSFELRGPSIGFWLFERSAFTLSTKPEDQRFWRRLASAGVYL